METTSTTAETRPADGAALAEGPKPLGEVRVSTNIPATLKAELDAMAAAEMLSTSALLRRLIDQSVRGWQNRQRRKGGAGE